MTKRIHSKISLFIIVVLFLTGLFFTIYDSPKTEASTWLLSGGTITWDNNQFIDETFWNDDPSDNDIIKALYGSGDEGSIYTKNWTGWDGTQCSGFDMEVIETGSLPENLSDNTIYVLTGDAFSTDVVIQAGTCSSVISKHISGTTINSSIYIYTIFTNNGGNIILDNLTVDGTGSHVTNLQGIYFGNDNNFTTNKVNVYNATNTAIRIQNAGYASIYNGSVATNEGNGHGIEVRNDSHDCVISNMNIYNGIYGVMIHDQDNAINNSQIYNNVVGIEIIFSGAHTVNNTQIYNNDVGIRMWGTGTNTVINNTQIYNNELGIDFGYASSENMFNDIEVYNNGEGISLFEGTENFYYGNVQVFGNKDDVSGSGILIPGYPSDYPSLDLSTGDIITTGDTLFRNYITNPIDSNSSPLNEWSETLNGIQGAKIYGANSYFYRTTTKYSYGKDVLAQAAPIIYSGEEFVYGDDYDPTKYIGSNVTRITGELLGISDLATGVDFTVTGISDSLLVPNYSLFGNLINDLTGITLGESAEIEFATGDGEKRIITQLFSDIYYATHFQKNSTLEMSAPDPVVLLSPSSGTLFITGEIDLVWNALNDTLTGYVYEVISGGVVIQSGFTTTTGVNISLPSETTNDQYERRVYAIDLFDNTGERSETWGFGIDTIPPNQVILISPLSGTVFHTGTISFIWESLFDIETGSYYLEFLAGGTPIYNTTIQATGFTIPSAPDGTYERRVYAIDGFGFTGERSETWNFTVDTSTGCATRWDNDNFITGAFRSQNPTDGNIICALYGSGDGDTTAYTQHWSGWDGTQCSGFDMEVIETGALPENLSDNTIYVLTGNTASFDGKRNVANCSAIISKHSDGTTLFSDDYIYTGGMISNESKKQVILDNINMDGTNIFGGGTHTGNTHAIYLYDASNITINNVQAYNNRHGILVYFSEHIAISNNDLYNNETYGLRLYQSNNNIISNTVTYNDYYGLFIEGSTYNNVTNSQSYNNELYGLLLARDADYNVINNYQSYNNTSVGIYLDTVENNVFNNIQSYNNGGYGFISNHGSSGTILNNIKSYNNLYGIYYGDSLSHTYFYGENKVFYNVIEDIGGFSGNLFTGYISDDIVNGIDRETGEIVYTDIFSRDLITNPINNLGTYLSSWTGTGSSIHGGIPSYYDTVTLKYSYGSGISLQEQPIYYSGNSLLTGGYFDATKYIGSDVKKITGMLEGVHTTTPDLEFTLTGSSTDPMVSKYSLYGDIMEDITGIALGESATIEFIPFQGQQKVITQLYGDEYFATHFQRDSLIDFIGPTQVTLLSPSSGTIFGTGNIDLLWSGSYDTGVGLSGYIYEIMSGLTIIQSGFTITTGFTIPSAPDGTYERRVYALDILGNTGEQSETWSFSIDVPIVCANRWDNENFITGSFRDNDPTDGNIICALYGSGEGDMTAYTQHWSGWDGTQCDRGGMQVIHTGDLPSSLLGNTIYVLTDPTDIVSSYVYVEDCTAVVSSNATGTTMYSDVILDIPTKGTFNVNSHQYVIFDNISINGTGGDIVPSHNENENGIYLNKSTNTTIHSGMIYNNSMGINSQDSSYMKINDVKIYNNSSNAIWLYQSDNNIIQSLISDGNFNGIHVGTVSTNNVIQDSEFYRNFRGVYLATSSSKTKMSNSIVYNNTSHGINLNITSDNVFTNVQSYNNTDNGIRIYNATDNVFNNVQTYNNGSYGIYMASSATDNVFNNFNVYNNNSYGIYLLSSSSNNIFHKIYSYNNTNSGIYLDVTATGNKYYGDTRFTIAGTTGNIASGSATDLAGLGWLDGSITLRTVSRDYITNPSNTSGNYLLSWSGTLANLIGKKTSYLAPTEKYSYGSGIFTQIQPVLYSGTDVVASGSFDENNYIGSTVIKRTGDTQTVPEYTKYTAISLTGLSTDPIINTYSFLGHLDYFNIEEDINTLTGITLTTGDGTKFIITQLLGDDYYATHFQKNTFLDQTPPAQIILISPTSGTLFTTGNVNLVWSGSFDTGAGLSGYVYEVSTEIGFGSILYSGFTTDTGLDLLDLPEDTYYWKVYAIDNVENIVAWSSIRNFTIYLCNNGDLDSGETCDQGILNSSTGACSTSCEWNTPSCSLGVSPLTGYAPLTGTYSISNVDTGWMQFDWIDYGDGSTGATDTGTLEYTHIYSSTGVYTGILQVSNSYDTSITGQCEVSIEAILYEYCGDGIAQSPNSSGDIEICDGELGCDTNCERESASCAISATPSTGDVPFTTDITIDPIDPRVDFFLLDFGNGTIINSGDGLFTGQMNYTGTYGTAAVYTAKLIVYNTNNPLLTWSCETTITGSARCGNGILELSETCDQGILNSSTGACSTSCEWNTPSCSLGVSPLTGYAPLTGTYSISNVDTGWMQFDWIDYGDGSTGATDTGTLEYTHIYSSTGVYTGILQVSNSYNTSITGQCEVSIESISLPCVDVSWTPNESATCSPNNLTQTSNCGNTRIATGTRNCGGGGGGGVVTDNCCEDSNLPGANDDCLDDSPSYYDNTCISPFSHQAAGKMCKYDDEEYIGQGPFTDTENHWGYNYIEMLRKSCLHRGRGAAEGIWEYEPDGYITKAEVMKTMIKILGMDENDFDIQDEDIKYPYVNVFIDVPSTHWFSWYAEYGYIRGLTNGMYTIDDTGRHFTPDEYITRNEAIKRIMMLYTMVNSDAINVTTPTVFTDLKENDPYYDYIRMAEEYGFVVGVQQADGSYMFEGTRPITRAEFAKIVTKPFNGLLFEYTAEE